MLTDDLKTLNTAITDAERQRDRFANSDDRATDYDVSVAMGCMIDLALVIRDILEQHFAEEGLTVFIVRLNGTIGPIFREVLKVAGEAYWGVPSHFQTVTTGNELMVLTNGYEFANRLKQRFTSDPKAAEGRCMKVNGIVTPHWEGKL